MSSLPVELDGVSPQNVRELDVRPIIDAGGKPFDHIMAAIEELPEDGALKMLAPFKPAPLIKVLEREGWRSVVDRASEGHWLVWFYRPPRSDS